MDMFRIEKLGFGGQEQKGRPGSGGVGNSGRQTANGARGQ